MVAPSPSSIVQSLASTKYVRIWRVHKHKSFKLAVTHNLVKVGTMNKKLVQSELVTRRTYSNLPRVCKRIKVSLLKLKGCSICIKNDLIEIAPFPLGNFDHFLLAFIPKPDDFRNFSQIRVNIHAGFKFRNSHCKVCWNK